ncbi:MAG TPA: NYN domain-containing protein [Terriglobia bacterium]|nr:NYN domain-containing protein [Terriglobia bacterium]
MAEERLKLAVFVDFDNIQIGVKDTLGKDFDVSVVLEALKERGEVITKIAYSDWSRASEFSRQMTQHAVQMVQRNVTPRGDKNGADINLALDALEMAFTRHHINSFAIVGGDSDFIALVEKLKQYDKRVFVVGGRGFTSNILQRNCTEFIAYENLLRTSGSGDGGARPRPRRGEAARATLEVRPLSDALPNVQRALAVLAEREVSPQLGLLKSTLLQLDSTFSERDYGAGSFLEFMQKMEQAGLLHLRKLERGYRVEVLDAEGTGSATPEARPVAESVASGGEPVAAAESAPAGETSGEGEPSISADRALAILRQALELEAGKSPNRPLYLRHIRHGLKAVDKDFDERRAGFQGLTDFLYRAQREGWLSLQRDRNGVLRVFCRPQGDGAPESEMAAPAVAHVSEDGTEAAPVQAEAAAVTDFWQSSEMVVLPGETLAAAAPPTGETSEDQPAEIVSKQTPLAVAAPKESAGEVAPAEAAPARKGRARRTGGPAKPRRSASRRKTKDSAE